MTLTLHVFAQASICITLNAYTDMHRPTLVAYGRYVHDFWIKLGWWFHICFTCQRILSRFSKCVIPTPLRWKHKFGNLRLKFTSTLNIQTSKRTAYIFGATLLPSADSICVHGTYEFRISLWAYCTDVYRLISILRQITKNNRVQKLF